MKRPLRIVIVVISIAIVAVLVVPFLIPVPPLEDTQPPRELADPDSRFMEVDDLDVHYKMMGEGVPALVLLHGFAASTFSWREVMPILAEEAMVVAFDRPAFGLTQRPMPGDWSGENPYTTRAQADLTVHLMDELGLEQVVLVGNSAGGTVAALVALEYPERVEALVMVDAAIYSSGSRFPAWLNPLLTSPQMRRLGPLLVRSIEEWGIDFGRSAWHDPSRLTPDIWAGYTRPLRTENWDRALWELTVASRPLDLEERLDELRLPVLVITGDDDRIVPPEQSRRLASELPNAELVVIPDCGHVPHEECPGPTLEAIEAFLAGSVMAAR